MKKITPWSLTEENEAISLRARGQTYAAIAVVLARSVRSVEKKFTKMRKQEPWQYIPDNNLPNPDNNLSEPASITNGPHPDWKTAPYPGDKNVAEEKTCEERAAYWKTEAQRLQGVLSSRTHEKTAVEILVEQISELAPKSYQPVSVQIPPKDVSGSGSAQSAVLLFSDTHVGQTVSPDQTLGMGGYGFDIFLRRLARLERSIFSILREHTTTRVEEIVIAMLGDILHGNLQHSVEAGQTNTIFSQFYSAGHAIAQFFIRLSSLVPLVRVYTAVGNHPRWGTQKKMPTDNRYSNFDQLLYAYVAALVKNVECIEIHLDKQPFSRFDVQGFHFLAGHGDHLRGGDKNLGIPNHAIGRNVNVHSQLAMRSGNPVPNYFLVGHLHRPITIPHCMGEFIVNGGFPGIDGYALAEAFNSSYPSQKLFLMHPKFGRSATYDLRLDLGDSTPHSYQLPDKFCCL